MSGNTAIDREIDALIAQHDPLRRAAKVLTSMAGVGPKTAAALLALMPELGHLNRRQIAPWQAWRLIPGQSEATDAYRRTKGSRPEIKRILFMAALSAARYGETLRRTYQRLLANGKSKLVALTAIMRKLVVIANAKLRDDNQQVDVVAPAI